MHRAKGDRFVRANGLPVRQCFFFLFRPCKKTLPVSKPKVQKILVENIFIEVYAHCLVYFLLLFNKDKGV